MHQQRPAERHQVRPAQREQLQPDGQPVRQREQLQPDGQPVRQPERQRGFRPEQQHLPQMEIVRPNPNYDAAVRRGADFTQDQYDHALRTAAAEGKAVILVFGSSRSPSSQQEMDSIAQTKRGLANGAVIVHIDVDKVDPRSKIGEYTNQHVRPRGVPFTMVFDQKFDQQGHPVPEVPVDYFAGSADTAVLGRRLSNSVARAGEIQQWHCQNRFEPYRSQRDLYNYYDDRSQMQPWQSQGMSGDNNAPRYYGQRTEGNYYQQPYRYPMYENNYDPRQMENQCNTRQVQENQCRPQPVRESQCNSGGDSMECGGRTYNRRMGGCRVLSLPGRLLRRCR
jgi:hypothetical protein